jgi:hypothetical protein
MLLEDENSMVDESYLHNFRDAIIYSPNSMTRPWNSKMSDEELLELYERAKEVKADEGFIRLILEEMKKRIVNKIESVEL